MAGLNRIGSPMDICDEGYDDPPDVIDKRKRDLQSKQTAKSPFLIGTIEDVNKKISKLEQRLQNYTQLVVESRASDYPELSDSAPTSAFGRRRYKERERENKEVCKFAGIYTMKSTFLPNLSTRVKNISKISMQPPKEKKHIKMDPGKPKFVELHSYPGYDPIELTPLPFFTAVEVLHIVVNASVNLDKKPQYQPEFQRLFFSPMSQAVLQDIFWYTFLDKFQPNAPSQQKLFNRTAHNYVKLIFYAKSAHFRDTFLKDYPLLISQAVYACFCHCFPDSYRQFGEIFKNDLVYLVYGWMAGLRPSPRCWLEWNMDGLEPANIKMREELMNRHKKKQAQAMTVNFDYLDSLVSSNPSQYPSTLSLDVSKSSMGSTRKISKRPRNRKISKRSYSPEECKEEAPATPARSQKKSIAFEEPVVTERLPARTPTVCFNILTPTDSECSCAGALKDGKGQKNDSESSCAGALKDGKGQKTDSESSCAGALKDGKGKKNVNLQIEVSSDRKKQASPVDDKPKIEVPAGKVNIVVCIKGPSFVMVRDPVPSTDPKNLKADEKTAAPGGQNASKASKGAASKQNSVDSVSLCESRDFSPELADLARFLSERSLAAARRAEPAVNQKLMQRKYLYKKYTSTPGSRWRCQVKKQSQNPVKTSQETLSQDSNVIDTVASAQPSPKKGGDGGLDSHRSTQDGETQRRTKAEGGGDGLSPIRELASEEGTVSGEEKKLSQYSPSVTRKPPAVKKLRSHPACKGPDYLKTAFNIHGRSPLVSHFLRMRNITTDANVVTRMQRTELDNLPPLDAKTYSDVVRESSKTVKSIEKYFQESYGRHQKEVSLFLNQQAAEMTEYRKRENLLLSKKPEVHRLSDLIILEQKKGVGSISAGASQAVVAALMSMDP